MSELRHSVGHPADVADISTHLGQTVVSEVGGGRIKKKHRSSEFSLKHRLREVLVVEW